jgi:RNA polymerase sigma-70 factor (ECF subfamily)
MFPPLTPKQTIDKTVREEWGRILASLVGGLKDFQLAEDCLQDAVISAMNHWSKNGLPRSPAGWSITVARRKALDKLRRAQNFAAKQDEISYLLDLKNKPIDENLTGTIPDKRLKMIFTCCHPVLDPKSQITRTLRTLGGLSTDKTAGSFLDKSDPMQQRITRAKKKIADAGVSYEIPETADLPGRITSVLSVIYLIFNEGYSATSGENILRTELTNEAIRVARILHILLPEDTEVAGLLALMLLHDSRRQARTDEYGTFISLEMQNRKRWNSSKIAEGISILKATLPRNDIGPYQLQAAISGAHAQSAAWDQTDWQDISALYGLLFEIQPSPVVRINQAIAVSYAQSLEKALTIMEEVSVSPKMQTYQHYHAAMGDLLMRAGKTDPAKDSLRKAMELSNNAKEVSFLANKIQQL